MTGSALGPSVDPSQLLAEVDDLLAETPAYKDFASSDDSALEWLGRAGALVDAWDFTRSPTAHMLIGTASRGNSVTLGATISTLRTLLFQARASLQMRLPGRTTIAVGAGMTYQYFEGIRTAIAEARSDLFFVDPYLDADFVSRYLVHVSRETPVRLLAREKLPTLLPAVDALTRERAINIAVRSAAGFHDRYFFVDRVACYQSGASFKDGGRTAATTITQITDAATSVFQTYDTLWSTAKVER